MLGYKASAPASSSCFPRPKASPRNEQHIQYVKHHTETTPIAFYHLEGSIRYNKEQVLVYLRGWRAKEVAQRAQTRSKRQTCSVLISVKNLPRVTLCQCQLCEWVGSASLRHCPFHLESHHESCGHEGTGRTLRTSPC